MKFSISKSEFQRAIQAVSRAVPSRGPLPVLTNIYLEADDSGLSLEATDLDIGIRVTVKADVKETGAILLPAKMLGEIVAKVADGDVSIEVEGNDARIKAGRSKFTLRGTSASEFPDLPTATGEPVKLDAQALAASIKAVAYAAADEEKAVICGVLLKFTGEKVILAATDGYRLASVELAGANIEPRSLVIPRRTMEELSRHLGQMTGEVSISAEGSQVVFSGDGRILTSRLIDGQFPPYEQIIPKDFASSSVVNREAFLGAVERVAVLANEREANIIEVAFAEDVIRITGGRSEIGEAAEDVPAGFTGEPVTMQFNADFLAAALKAADAGAVRIEMNDRLKPVILTPEDRTTRLALVMPVNRV